LKVLYENAFYPPPFHFIIIFLLLQIRFLRAQMDDSQGEETDTPLWAAVFHRRVDVARFLVAQGADATCTNGNGITVNQVWVCTRPTHRLKVAYLSSTL